jgi:hypothetical protein
MVKLQQVGGLRPGESERFQVFSDIQLINCCYISIFFNSQHPPRSILLTFESLITASPQNTAPSPFQLDSQHSAQGSQFR